MAHFAKLDNNNIVTAVHVVNNNELLDNGIESEAKGIAFLKNLYGHEVWKQTSYNGNIRKNYAGIGYTYDEKRDAFIPPQPFKSWKVNEHSCLWDPPIPYPNDGFIYKWNEDIQKWEPA